MVQLVNSLVKRAVVQCTMEEVVPCILHNKENGDVHSYLGHRGKGDAIIHAKVSGDGVEEPDLWQLHREMREKHEASAIPLFFDSWNLSFLDLPFIEEGRPVNNHPRDTPPKVDQFVHNKRHDACGENIILHPKIPGLCKRKR